MPKASKRSKAGQAKEKSNGLCAMKYCRNRRPKGRRVCWRCTIAQWRKTNPLRYRWRVLKDRAKRKRLPFSLSFDEFVEFVARHGLALTLSTVEIDRRDATQGYTADNIQPLSESENVAKGNRERMTAEYRKAFLVRGVQPPAAVYSAPESAAPYVNDWADPDVNVCTRHDVNESSDNEANPF